jgi:hypothetical protein
MQSKEPLFFLVVRTVVGWVSTLRCLVLLVAYSLAYLCFLVSGNIKSCSLSDLCSPDTCLALDDRDDPTSSTSVFTSVRSNFGGSTACLRGDVFFSSSSYASPDRL